LELLRLMMHPRPLDRLLAQCCLQVPLSVCSQACRRFPRLVVVVVLLLLLLPACRCG
jgi:hypothetical protein